MSYVSIKNFGPSVKSQSNPLVYCATTELLSGFSETLGGNNLMGPNSSQCQRFMAEYCGNNWDGVCEYLSQDTRTGGYMNTVMPCNSPYNSNILNGITKGQILIRNAAAEKYLIGMSGNCQRVYQPFDPTVADSPLISTWQGWSGECGSTSNCYADNKCIPIYGVDAKNIDNDPIMNKLLDQPWIGMDILVNIYNTSKTGGTLEDLVGTKLYAFFQTESFQKSLKGTRL